MNKEKDKSNVFLSWLVLAIIAFTMAAAMSGCNTVRGVGALMKGIGEDVEEAANGIQHQMAETDR